MWSNKYRENKFRVSIQEEWWLGQISRGREGSWSVNLLGLEILKTMSIDKKIVNLKLGIINRGVSYKSAEVMSKLYWSYGTVSSFGNQ